MNIRRLRLIAICKKIVEDKRSITQYNQGEITKAEFESRGIVITTPVTKM